MPWRQKLDSGFARGQTRQKEIERVAMSGNDLELQKRCYQSFA